MFAQIKLTMIRQDYVREKIFFPEKISIRLNFKA